MNIDRSLNPPLDGLVMKTKGGSFPSKLFRKFTLSFESKEE